MANAHPGIGVTIEAKINGQGPFRFGVDTGAGAMLTISKALQQTLQLESARPGDGLDGLFAAAFVIAQVTASIAASAWLAAATFVDAHPRGLHCRTRGRPRSRSDAAMPGDCAQMMSCTLAGGSIAQAMKV